jgi:hypothetical protein
VFEAKACEGGQGAVVPASAPASAVAALVVGGGALVVVVVTGRTAEQGVSAGIKRRFQRHEVHSGGLQQAQDAPAAAAVAVTTAAAAASAPAAAFAAAARGDGADIGGLFEAPTPAALGEERKEPGTTAATADTAADW